MASDGSTASRRARSPRGEGQRLRCDILEVAQQLLLDTGSLEAVSIRAVADAVGVTPPSIYRHFADKTALIFEVCNHHFSLLDERFAQATEGLDDPVEALAAIARAYVDFGLENPEPYRIMFMSHVDATPEEFRDGRFAEKIAFGRTIRWSTEAIGAGRLRPEHRDPVEVTISLWAHVHGLASLLISKPEFPWPGADYIDDYIATYFRGLVAGDDPAA
jgi:AcrR family transcriptional regulator